MDSLIFLVLVFLYWSLRLLLLYVLAPLFLLALVGGALALLVYMARLDLANFKRAYRR